MKHLLTVAFLCTCTPVPVLALDAAVCRPYATAVTNALIKLAWEHAFNRCAALDPSQIDSTPDGIPIVPQGWRAVLDVVDPERTPVWPLDRADVDAVRNIGNVPAGDAPASGGFEPLQPPLPPTKPAPAPVPAEPGHAPGWAAHCAATHPRGWDAKSGTITVLKRKTWVRVPCPG